MKICNLYINKFLQVVKWDCFMILRNIHTYKKKMSSVSWPKWRHRILKLEWDWANTSTLCTHTLVCRLCALVLSVLSRLNSLIFISTWGQCYIVTHCESAFFMSGCISIIFFSNTPVFPSGLWKPLLYFHEHPDLELVLW